MAFYEGTIHDVTEKPWFWITVLVFWDVTSSLDHTSAEIHHAPQPLSHRTTLGLGLTRIKPINWSQA
jgi:hypothetical protein